MVRDAIKKTRDTADHSGLDAAGWHRILMSGNFGTSGEDLRKAIADMTNDYVKITQLNILKHL